MKQQARKFSRLFVLVPLCMVVAACGSDAVAPEPDPTVSGSWSGTTGTTTLTLTMNEAADGTVTGGGSISDVTSAALTISTGTHVFPNLSLTLTATGFEDMNLTGTVSATAIAATLNGSGFVNLNLNMTKQ